MATIEIDGKQYEVNADNNLLQECLSKGLDLPYFCWHPCMGSVGACRQCAVKQYKDKDDEKGIIVMACMTPATDGSIISIKDEQAGKFRANVIESLMISHPHDCPVCEEGGECHLQDMTLMSGHNYRRYDRNKVTHRNQYLGPFVGHEMNRCITCYRCVRFYDDYAGGTDLSAQACHHHTYFGRQTDGFLESEFSGNLVEVCPTGVFTDATFSAHYTRKWDLQSAPAVCTGCSTGCNTTPAERHGRLRRVVNRYNSEVNGYFICDRGRFGYGFINSEKRITAPRGAQASEALPLDTAHDRLQALLAGGGKLLGIGSPRASTEANYALMQAVGPQNFHAGCSDVDFAITSRAIEAARDPAFHTPSIRDMEDADAVLIVGEDVTNTTARVALALRQAVRNRADEIATGARIPLWQDAAVRELAQGELSPLYVLAGYATRLDDVARATHVADVAILTALTRALANGLDDSAPGSDAELDEGQAGLVAQIAQDLKGARRPLILTGAGSGSTALVEAAVDAARALFNARGSAARLDFCVLLPEVNSMGLGLLAGPDSSLGSALAAMAAGEVDAAIVLENDLYLRAPAATVDSALAGVSELAVLDLLETGTTQKASLVLATTSFAEQEGTFVNYEGRAQLSMQVFQTEHQAQPAWRWLSARDQHFDSLLRECAGSTDVLAGLADVLPDPARLAGGMKVPRQSHRYSGRTAMFANLHVHESKQPVDDESVMSFSMEGLSPLKESSILASSWAPRWNSNQSITKFQDEVAGELKQGNNGCRLLDDKIAEPGRYIDSGVNINDSGEGLRVVPARQLYGSDELSSHSEAIEERLIGPYIALAPRDADKLGITGNALVSLTGQAGSRDYAACVRSSVRPGTVVVFDGAVAYPVAEAGEAVALDVREGRGRGRFDNLIVSDLQEQEVGQ